jgi:hypothetical protein
VDCCELYTPCRVDTWIDKNPELHDSELHFFKSLLDTFKDYIEFDIEEIDIDEEPLYPELVDEYTRLRQLYTVINRFLL